jgi:hypothetical protein
MYNNQQPKNHPIFKVKDGNVSAAVFQSQYGPSVSLQKYIFNKETQQGRNESMFLNPNDLMKVVFVLFQTKGWLAAQPEPQKNTQQPMGTAAPQQSMTTASQPPANPGTPYSHPFGG